MFSCDLIERKVDHLITCSGNDKDHIIIDVSHIGLEELKDKKDLPQGMLRESETSLEALCHSDEDGDFCTVRGDIPVPENLRFENYELVI